MNTIAWLSLAEAIYAMVSAITFFYVVAGLQISEYGIYSICSSIYIVHEFCLREGLENSILKSNLALTSINFQSNKLIIKWIIALTAIAITLYVLREQSFLSEYWVMILLCLLISALQLPTTKYRALSLKSGKGPLLAIASMIAGIGSCIVAIVSISSNLGVFALITQQISYHLISILIFSIILRNKFTNPIGNDSHTDDISKDTLSLLPATLLTALSNRADILVIGAFFNTESVGIYSVIKRLFQIYIDIFGSPIDKFSFLRKGNELFYLKISGIYFVLMYAFFVSFYGLKEIFNEYFLKTNTDAYTNGFIALTLIVLIISSATNTAKSKLITAKRIALLTKIKIFETFTWLIIFALATTSSLELTLIALIIRSLFSYATISFYSFKSSSFITLLIQLVILFGLIAISYICINHFSQPTYPNLTEALISATKGISTALLLPTLIISTALISRYWMKKNNAKY